MKTEITKKYDLSSIYATKLKYVYTILLTACKLGLVLTITWFVVTIMSSPVERFFVFCKENREAIGDIGMRIGIVYIISLNLLIAINTIINRSIYFYHIQRIPLSKKELSANNITTLVEYRSFLAKYLRGYKPVVIKKFIAMTALKHVVSYTELLSYKNDIWNYLCYLDRKDDIISMNEIHTLLQGFDPNMDICDFDSNDYNIKHFDIVIDCVAYDLFAYEKKKPFPVFILYVLGIIAYLILCFVLMVICHM